MQVKIKKFHPEAVVPFKTHQSDFCYDVTAVSCEEIAPNVYKYELGIGFQIEREGGLTTREHEADPSLTHRFPLSEQFFQLSIKGKARSSVHKTGMILANCEAVIDEGFVGPVSFVFYHLIPTLPIYQPGDRIGQIELDITVPMDFVEVAELDSTVRGTGAFGSTGK